jgi:hypothetical protein
MPWVGARAVSEGGGAPDQARWAGALGSIEDAKVALDVLARAIDDAVYLDEDAYAQMLPLQQLTRTVEARALGKGLHEHACMGACVRCQQCMHGSLRYTASIACYQAV